MIAPARREWRRCEVERTNTRHREEGPFWRCMSCGHAECEDLTLRQRASAPQPEEETNE